MSTEPVAADLEAERRRLQAAFQAERRACAPDDPRLAHLGAALAAAKAKIAAASGEPPPHTD